jgi:hypothetical protein
LYFRTAQITAIEILQNPAPLLEIYPQSVNLTAAPYQFYQLAVDSGKEGERRGVRVRD